MKLLVVLAVMMTASLTLAADSAAKERPMNPTERAQWAPWWVEQSALVAATSESVRTATTWWLCDMKLVPQCRKRR